MNYSKVISGTLIAFTIYMSVKNGLSLLRDGVAFNEMVAALHVTSAVMNALIGITEGVRNFVCGAYHEERLCPVHDVRH